MRSFWTTADLRAQGLSSSDVRKRVRTGERVRVRPGWFADPFAGPELIRAVRLGGLATAHTAARSLGLWTPPDAGTATFRRRTEEPCVLHVAVPSTAALGNLRDPDTGRGPFEPRPHVALHWTPRDRLRLTIGSGRVDLFLMLAHLFTCETPERALAVLDSALHLRMLHVRDLHALADRLPAHLRAIVFATDGRAESGIETIVRFRLRTIGLDVLVQPELERIGRADMLVDGRLIIECDGREWHEDDEAFERDRNRDLVATRGRYRVLRVTWFQVLFRWPEVEAAVLAALALS